MSLTFFRPIKKQSPDHFLYLSQSWPKAGKYDACATLALFRQRSWWEWVQTLPVIALSTPGIWLYTSLAQAQIPVYSEGYVRNPRWCTRWKRPEFRSAAGV